MIESPTEIRNYNYLRGECEDSTELVSVLGFRFHELDTYTMNLLIKGLEYFLFVSWILSTSFQSV